MNLQRRALCFLSALLFCGDAFSRELPPALKHTAEQYDNAQKGFDASVEAQMKAARDGYLAVLGAARKREEGAKRAAAVAGIDAEIAAVKAGPIEGKAPEQLPADLGNYRNRFIAQIKQAAVSNDSVRKQSTEQYLNWLSGMEAAAKGKDETLRTAILAEKKRVLDSAQRNDAGTK